MKKIFVILSVCFALVLSISTALAADKETIQVWWYEDAMRYNADGSLYSSWTNDRIPPASPMGYVELTITGKSYHGDMEWFYNYYPLADFSATPFIIPGGNGKLAVWARYTSPRSGLPILDKIRGQLVVEPDESDPSVGTARGSYTQYSYIESCDAEAVGSWYPLAEATDDPCVWLGSWTDYTVHGQDLTP